MKAGKDAQSDGTKDLLREAKKLVATYNETPTADHFVTLLDWSFFSVHNGDLDSRDNVGLRAIWDWTREGVAYPGARAVDHLGPRRRPAQADGLRPRGSGQHQAA